MSENKVKFGLKNVHYAVVSENNGAVNYSLPQRVAGAVNINLPPRGEKSEFYADDMAYFVTTANQGYEGTLELALIPDKMRKDVLGDVEDSNGALIEKSDAIPKNIALMFEFTHDKNNTRHVIYNVAVARPNLESKTKGQSAEVITETLNISAAPATDTGNVKAKQKYGQPGYDTFFSAVYLEDQAINTPHEANVEFDKYSSSDVTVKAISSAGTNAIYDVRVAGVSMPPVKLTIDGLQAKIDKSAFTHEVGTYTITLVLEKGNAVDFKLVVKDTTP